MKSKKAGKRLFYDSYALICVARGERNYAPYSDNDQLVTSMLNLYELYYGMLKDGLDEKAEEIIQKLSSTCLDITPATIMMAAHIRKGHSKKKISYIDALGYVLAQREGIPFLTGDKEFKNMPGVEFVK